MKTFIIYLCLLFSLPCFSEELDVRVTTFDGKKFVCFTERDSQALLQMRLDLPKLQQLTDEYSKLVDIKNAEIVVLTSATDNLKEQISDYTVQVAALNTELENMQAWWRSSYLWFGVGLLVGVGTTVAIVSAVN